MTAEPEVVDPTKEGLAVAQPVSADSPSILGKRNSDHLSDNIMDIDRADTSSPEKILDEDESISADPKEKASLLVPPPVASPSIEAQDLGVSSSHKSSVENPYIEMIAKPGIDGVMEILPNTDEQAQRVSILSDDKEVAPPLPARPPQNRANTTIANTNMMFGRQNDVSEAMDNGMYDCIASTSRVINLNFRCILSSNISNRGWIG